MAADASSRACALLANRRYLDPFAGANASSTRSA
jgi:hypothetical protein